MTGSLYIVSTPIGNLEDITIRALKTLFSVDNILAEDTRRSGSLLEELQKKYPDMVGEKQKPPLISYYDQIEEKRLPEIVTLLEEGKQLALISDNGTPTISDPGFRLVRECRKRNIPVISIPGPSAAIAALSISGLPTNHFTFLGFLPEKQGQRLTTLNKAKEVALITPTTFVLYCAPHKLDQTLIDIQSVFGDCEAVLARELTKIYETVLSGTISTIVSHLPEIKGECVLLFRLGK